MKIFGDKSSSKFKNYVREPGTFFGSNDVLKGPKKTFPCYDFSLFGNSSYLQTVEPKLYLHIPTSLWTTFTGKLREYLLPWRWKTAYLDREDGTPLRQILVCTYVKDGKLSDRLKTLLGKSLLVANLVNNHCYDEIFGQEFLLLQGQNSRDSTLISDPLGEGLRAISSNDLYCHIYRPRSLFSKFKYNLVKKFSTSWKEVTMRVEGVSEQILIRKSDEAKIAHLKLQDKPVLCV